MRGFNINETSNVYVRKFVQELDRYGMVIGDYDSEDGSLSLRRTLRARARLKKGCHQRPSAMTPQVTSYLTHVLERWKKFFAELLGHLSTHQK